MRSAGLLLVRGDGEARQVLLVHPGGPFWAKKDEGAWSISKGEVGPGEDALATAKREFAEELGHPAPEGPFFELGEVKQKSGKVVVAFAARGDLDATTIRSNEIDIDWPPRSGKKLRIPEVDRAEWFDVATARIKINPAQLPLLERAFLLPLPQGGRGSG